MTATSPAGPSRAGAVRRSAGPPRPAASQAWRQAWRQVWRQAWRQTLPDAVRAAALTTLAVVVALWVSGGGLRDLTTTSGGGIAVTSLGRLAGLLAADLMLLQVLGMARIPWVERSFGQDRLARLHRLAGFWSFWLLVGHVALVTLGYAQSARSGWWSESWLLVRTYPGMLLATAASALIVLVVALSIRAARRRLRYESWHLIHLYAYLGIGLALPHQLWTGQDFVSSPAARAYWWTLYVGALASVLGYRIGLPLRRTLRHRLVVSAVVEESPGVRSVHLTGRDLHRLPVRSGQFFLWRFLDGTGGSRAHPYSLSAPPHERLLRITVKELGDGSAEVARLRPGTKVLVEGPYGRLTAERRTRRRVLLMAAGVGITPLRALLEDLPYDAGEATLLYRAHCAAELTFRAELEKIAERRGARLDFLTGPRARRADGGSSWLPASQAQHADPDALRLLVPDVAARDVFVCGPQSWAAAATAAARAAGVPARQVHEERFAW